MWSIAEQATWIEQAKTMAGNTIEAVELDVDGSGRIYGIVLKCAGQSFKIDAETQSHGGCWLEVNKLE